MATYTQWFNLALPTVGGDPVVWADMLNANTGIIDGVLHDHDLQIDANAAAITLLNSSKIGEAPADSQEYVRKDNAWAVATGGGAGGGIPEAPVNGNDYWRNNAGWTVGNWTNLDGKPTSFTPAIHATSHATGSSDPVTPASIGAATASHTHSYLPLAGGTLTGPLVLAAAPAAPLQAATKQYVDDSTAHQGQWAWDDSALMVDPGTGEIRGNSANMGAITAFAASKTDSTGRVFSLTGLLAGDLLLVQSLNTAATGRYEIQTVTDSGTWAQINVLAISGNGNPLSGEVMTVILSPAGASTGVPEAPADGQDYWRNANAWVIGNWTNLEGKPATFPPSAHTHPASEISAGGTPDSTTFLRGDNLWAVPTGGGGGTGAVDSVFGRIGDVVALVGDYAGLYLPIGGGTLTGPLVLAGAPTVSLNAATKAYVDNLVAANTGTSGVWAWDDSTTMADPGIGEIRGNAATMAAITAFAVNKTDSQAISYGFALLSPGDIMLVGAQVGTDAGRYSIASIVDNGAWVQINVTLSGNASGNPATASLMNATFVPDSASTGVGEAPTDGQDYWRNNSAWVVGNWSNLAGIPATFPPAAHNQAITTITGSGRSLFGISTFGGGQGESIVLPGVNGAVVHVSGGALVAGQLPPTDLGTLAASALLGNPTGVTASPVAITLANTLQFAATTLGVNNATIAPTWTNVTGKPTAFAPSAHAVSHGSGGGDPITPAAIGAAASTHTHAVANITPVTALSVIGNPSNASAAATVITASAAGEVLTRVGNTLAFAAPAPGGIADAPTDGQDYWRNNGAWVIGTWASLAGIPATFAPSAHAASHATAGGDPITPAAIGAAGLGANTFTGNQSGPDFIITSDKRLKDSIQTLDPTEALALLGALRPVTFEWKVGGRPDFGLIAQEVMQIIPKAVSMGPTGEYGVGYAKLVAYAIAAIQAQQEQIAALEKRVTSLGG
jgi:hypothetical protein